MNAVQTKRVKLTEAQQNMLTSLAGTSESKYGCFVADGYPPIKKLFQLGFVERRAGRYSSLRYFITDAGKAWLESA